ncbi:MAG: FkbM family methyltransferase [Actinomycetota bacterium]|nr:FkbM family methyltransferase [Actinomycetota bacterium]
MTVAQRVLDAILAGSPATLAGRARLKAAIEARKLLIRLGDPVVRCRVGDANLALPLSHELPFYRKDHPLYGEAVGRIAAALGGPVVDIGANVGDTAAIVRGHTDVPVLCVEGDPLFFELLARNAAQLGDVELEHAFVEAPEVGRVERARGTARVAAGATELRGKPLPRILADHPRFAEPALVKLDTDGMDVSILTANLDLLERVRPVLFFEYDPHLGATPEVFVALSHKGYERAIVFENTGEYRETVELADTARIDALHGEYTGHGGRRYVDVCVLPEGAETPVNALLARGGSARPLG